MTALATAIIYLVGAAATAAYLHTRPPTWVNPGTIARDLRTARPDATEQGLQAAVSRARFAVMLTAAALWPLVALATAIGYPGIMWRRWRAGRNAITVGKTITIGGRPMLIISISEQWDRGGGHSARFTCTGPTPRRLPGVTVRGGNEGDPK